MEKQHHVDGGVDQEVEEVFGDSTLGAVVLFLFFLSLLNELMDRDRCTC